MIADKWSREFQQAMENDLDTPRAVEVMVGLAGEIIKSPEQGKDVAAAQEALQQMGQVLGLRIGKVPEARVLEGWGEHLKRFE